SVPLQAPPVGLDGVRSPPDHASIAPTLPPLRGDRAVRREAAPRQGHAVRLALGRRHLPEAERGASLPVPPRVDALVSEGAPRPEVRGRDGLRSVRPSELPQGRGDPGRRGGGPPPL